MEAQLVALPQSAWFYKLAAALFLMADVAMRVLIITFFLLSPLFGQIVGSRARQHAELAIKEHHFQKAVAILTKLTKANPQDASLWTLRGIALGGLNKIQASLNSFDKALDLTPTYLPALEGVAQTAYMHKVPMADKYVNALLAAYPENKVANAMAGALAYASGTCPAAIKFFARAGAYVYSSPIGVSEYAACLLEHGAVAKAVSILRNASQLHPGSVNLKYNLAVAELDAHNPSAAVAVLRPLSDTADSGLLNLLASAYKEAGDSDSAFRILERAIRLSPRAESNYLDLATLCLDHNQDACAIQAASAGIAEVPNPTSLYLIRGVAYGQLGKYTRAKRDFDAAARLSPGRSQSAIAMSLLYAARSKPAKERAQLARQLARTPNDAIANYLMASLLMSSGAKPGQTTFATAKEHLERSLQVNPSSAQAQILMGEILNLEGNRTDALAHLERALKIAPDNRAALFQTFLLLHRLHRPADAAGVLKRLKTLINSQAGHHDGGDRMRVEQQ